LLHHAYVVRANPDLSDLAILYAVYRYLWHRNLLAGRRHALKLARVDGMERHASRDLVAFSDLVFEHVLSLRESRKHYVHHLYQGLRFNGAGIPGKSIRILAVLQNRKDLISITELCEAGKVVPVIDRQYPLREVPEALRYVAEGRAKGKVVIIVENDNKI